MNERMRVVPRQPQHEPSVRLDGVRVLVVEDHPDTCELIAVVLRQSGADVRTAGSLAEAVSLREHEDVDIVVRTEMAANSSAACVTSSTRTMPRRRQSR